MATNSLFSLTLPFNKYEQPTLSHHLLHVLARLYGMVAFRLTLNISANQGQFGNNVVTALGC